MIGRSFGRAATTYESNATLQRLVAGRLALRIAGELARTRSMGPLRVLEIGCGTGLLTQALRRLLPDSLIVATDLAPAMLQACSNGMGDDPRLLMLAMDGAFPAVAGGFDLICSSLALQWFADPAGAILQLTRLLAPGGHLHLSTLVAGSLSEWRDAHRSEGLVDSGPEYPQADRLLRACGGRWNTETVAIGHPTGLAFVRALRGIGAHQPSAGSRPLGPGSMRRVLRRFEADHASTASYWVAYGTILQAPRRGVFVTGTDTGVGKTLVAACLVKAWDADYWKPMQTGLDEEPGDSETVARLTGIDQARLHPPALALGAALSPEDAAAVAHVVFDPTRLDLPEQAGTRPLVVEGAGGVMVPVGGGLLMIDLIALFGLPVVLVARSTLGTINHTLLSIAALRHRGIAIAGVVLNGPVSPGNRSALERHGGIRILAEIPLQDHLDAEAIGRLSRLMPAAGFNSAAEARPTGPEPGRGRTE
ncbi:dethiobiotin synthase [Lichenicola cladoniae]|nr:dethiobiotin synthase [Lichenicola cladoniae]